MRPGDVFVVKDADYRRYYVKFTIDHMTRIECNIEYGYVDEIEIDGKEPLPVSAKYLGTYNQDSLAKIMLLDKENIDELDLAKMFEEEIDYVR